MDDTLFSGHARRLARILGWGTLIALLMVPAIAMQFSSEVNWGPGDFVVIGGMLVLLGLGIEFAFAQGRSLGARLALAGLAVLAFLLVWVELAVGIFH